MPLLGELRHITKLRYWPLDAVLHDKYLFPTTEAESLSSFLLPMLRLNPDKRAKAGEVVHHRWLEGVVVQGEIDVVRRMEEEEEKKKTEGNEAAMASEVAPSPVPIEVKAPEEAEPAPEAVAAAAAATSKERKRASALALQLAQSEADAMKPVDDDLAGKYPAQ